jgi:AcrR family transcriptional regulator
MAQTRLSCQERRMAIIEAAIELFSNKGFRGATTRELASAVGVSEPVLYQHFATKRDLYAAILEEKAVAGERAIPRFGPEALDAIEDDRRFLEELAHGIIGWHTSDPSYCRLLMFSALEQHEFSELFFERYTKGFFTDLAAFFARRIEEGRYRDIDPMIAAQMFTGMAANYAINATLFHKHVVELPQQQTVETFVDIFLEGIRKRES